MKLAKVHLYTTTHCPYCRAAKSLLEQKGVEFEEIDLTYDLEKRKLLVEKHKLRTVPIIMINEELIGGYDQLVELERTNKLDELLNNTPN